MSEINFMRTAPSILLCSLKTLIHDMFLFVRQPIRFSSCTVLFDQISNEVSLKLSIHCYCRIPPLPFCANAVTAVFTSHVVESWHRRWIKFAKWKLVKISREHAIVIKITKNSKSIFLREKGLGRGTWLRNLSRLAMQNGSQNSISDAHFTYFPVWENCILESIEEPLTKKASKTAESCVETSDEDDNYDDDLSSNDVSGVVATNRTTEMS